MVIVRTVTAVATAATMASAPVTASFSVALGATLVGFAVRRIYSDRRWCREFPSRTTGASASDLFYGNLFRV